MTLRITTIDNLKTRPLLVHIIFHPSSREARNLARHIHKALNGDPAVPGLRVPTIFCAEDASDAPPASQYLNQAERAFVVPLADADLDVDEKWCAFVADLWEECQASGHRCLPIQLSEHAWPLDRRLRGVSFVRAFAEPAGSRQAFIVRRIVTELCRYLHGDGIGGDRAMAPTKMFISHTKLDLKKKPRVVEVLKGFLDQEQPVKSWYDTGDIPGGSLFAQQIADGIEDCSLLCVLTDNYASREWCRREILLAKERQRPIAVIDALNTQEVRSFPYIGNLPVIRWSDRPEDAVDLLLKETLRQLHCQAILACWRQPGDQIFTRAPELVTIVGLEAKTTVLYPDPPLGAEEARTLNKTGVSITTPLERLAKDRPLQGKKIALSMSESTDIHRFGFDEVHFEAAMLELTRYLLLKGATLVYGGHLGSEGYTVKLAELVRAHNQREGFDPVDRIENYVGWPLPLGTDVQSKYKEFAQLRRIPRPGDIDEGLHPDFTAEPAFFPGDQSALHRYGWARGMTSMRMAQTAQTQARILLGGNHGPTMGAKADGSRIEKWYYGRMPGLLEELLLSIEAGQPVFLIGAFGGLTAMVIDILEGRDRTEMSWDYQKQAPHAQEMRDIYRSRGQEWLDYPEMIETLRATGISGLNPHLGVAEHRELFYTRDILRMVQLILRGLDGV